MDLTSEQRAEYTTLIDNILSTADLATVSEKKIRNAMAEQLGYDLSEKKKAIGALIGERFDAMAESSSDNKPIAHNANGHAKANTSVKRRASESEAMDESDETPKKKQKRSKKHDNDAKLAAKLQAEENSRARPTRGGANKKATPAKKKKTPKKKSETKIKADDDSDIELGSDGERKERPKTGAFHKEYVLSTPLAELVGESQLSRPQVVKKIWVHIKALNLQDPDDKRQIICDDKMYAVFKQEKVHMFTMNKLLGKQLYPIEE